MRYIIFLLIPLFIYSKSFKIATYNVQNLFDYIYDGSEYKEYIPSRHNWTKKIAEIKLNNTAEVICDLNADILALQEIENSYVFKQLISKLQQVGCPYKYSAITSKKSSTIEVALLSKYPINQKKDIQVNYSSKSRNILEAEVTIDKRKLILFVNHWKSKSYKGYESKRIKYAKALVKRVKRLPSSKEYIILGDFNSDYDAYLTLNKKLDDANGLVGLGDVLKIKYDDALVDKYDMVGNKRDIYYSLWSELRLKDRWSHKYYGTKSTLDHIVLPKGLFDGIGIDYVNNSFKVFKPSYLFTRRGYINSWRYKSSKHQGVGYSDHLPIYAFFDTKPYINLKKKEKPEPIIDKNIDYLYDVVSLKNKVKLDEVVVVFKRGRNAVIKDLSPRGIYLFGCAKKLKEGHKYSLSIDAITSYNGLKEVTHISSIVDKGVVNLSKYIRSAKYISDSALKQNEIVKDVVGIYKNKYLYVNNKKLPIYFKNGIKVVKNGTKIKIDYAHIGYYKRVQLVLHSTKDFTVLE